MCATSTQRSPESHTLAARQQSSAVKFEDTTRLSFNLPKGLKLPAVQQVIEAGDGDDESKDEVRTRTVVPTVGCGEYRVELQLGKEMTSGKSVPFIGYGVCPCCRAWALLPAYPGGAFSWRVRCTATHSGAHLWRDRGHGHSGEA